MGLQFVFGGSGAGKSTTVYEKVIRQSMEHPEKNYLIMVPDQFTMYTQKQLCMMHPSGGIMNIDVLSFSRLIHRIAEEVGHKERVILDDTGKNLILRRVAMEKENDLVLLKDKVKRPGYIHEVKSVLSEFYQYDISSRDVEEMMHQAKDKGALFYKLQDIKVLYDGFAEYIKEKFITTEGALDELCHMIPKSELLKDSVIVFDGFTGFTPVQNRVISELLEVADEVIVTLCADDETDIITDKGQQHLFALTRKTYLTLVKLAEKNRVPIQSSVYLNGHPVKRHEANPPMAFLESNLFRYQNRVYGQEQDNISIWEADTLVSEVQRMCLEIKRIVREEGLCYRDIAVVTGSLDRYANLIQTEFDRYHIPFFIDQNRSVAHHPMTEYLKGALGILKDRFSYESVFRFLRCGMSSLTADETDRLEMYVRSCGIRGKKAYMQEFTYSDKAEEMNLIREKFIKELEPLLVKCKNAGDYAKALYELCRQNELQAKCNAYAAKFDADGNASKAKEYEKIYPACMDLLNAIYELVGDDEMDVAEFLSVLEAGIAEIRIGTIPQNVDQIVVGDMERTRLKDVRVLFFVGVNDGVIPGNGGNGGLLSDLERQFFMDLGRELAPTPRQKLFEQRLYLYQNMTKPSDRLYLSYSCVDGSGKAALPAYLIRVIQGLFVGIQIEKVTQKNLGELSAIATEEDGLDDFANILRTYLNAETGIGEQEKQKSLLKILCHAYMENETAERMKEASLTAYENVPLSDMAAELLYRDRNKGSVSRLEEFAGCAYAQFLKYGIELKEQKEYDFEALDFGIIYHHVLEVVCKELSKRQLTLAEADQELVNRIIDDTFDAYTKEYNAQILHSNARNERRICQMKKVMYHSVAAMKHQLSKGKFQPEYFEHKFHLKGEFPLVGKIDRIDLCHEGDEVYVKVVDYKTGERKFKPEELYYGLSLQLPAYMNAALETVAKKEKGKTVIPAAMLYSRLKNAYVDDAKKDIEHEIHMEMRPHGLVDETDKVIELLDPGLSGNSDVIRVRRKKEGNLDSNSQVVSAKMFEAMLDFTEVKMQSLMKQMSEGEIGVNPVQMEGDKNDSCTYCAYKGICRMDARIPGYRIKELPKLPEEKLEEEIKNEVHRATGKSYNDEE